MKIKQIIYKLLPQKIKEWRRLRDSKEYRIIKNPDAVFPIVYRIKEESWETVNKPEVFHIARASKQTLFHPAQNILEIRKCIISGGADYVLLDDECIWDKVYQDIFPITIPQDRGLMSYGRDRIRIQRIKKTRQVDGAVLSLLGVYSDTWSHFLMQFICKLYYAEEAGLLDEPITIIIPEYRDENIKELINDVLFRHDKVKTIIDKGNNGYHCEKLYYVETTSIVANHADCIISFAEVVPQRVKEKIHNEIVEPRIQSLTKKKKSNSSPSKIYLVRRDTYRKLENYDEVEQYFINRGFALIEPHKYTLQEKAELFYNADVIAGPMSSAWSNILFCKKEAKGLCLTPMCRTEELFIGYHADISGMRCMFVTGDDLSTTIHPDYTISIERIDAAYKQLLCRNESTYIQTHTKQEAVEILKGIVKKRIVSRVMVVHGKTSYEECGGKEIVEQLKAAFGKYELEVIDFDEFSANPKIEDVEKGLELVKKYHPEMVLAIGGGSAMDVAKLIRFWADGQKMHLVAIPTTSGTGAEVTQFAVCYENGVKTSKDDKKIRPDAAILVPELTMKNGKYLTACTGFDAFAQAVESLWNVNTNSTSEKIAMDALEILVGALKRFAEKPDACMADADWRKQMMVGANLAGQAINITRTTAPHAMSYKLTSEYGYPHGHAVALSFPYFAKLNIDCAQISFNGYDYAHYLEKMQKLKELLGVENENVEMVMREFVRQLGLGYDTKRPIDAEVVAKSVNAERAKNNPVKCTDAILLEAARTIMQ